MPGKIASVSCLLLITPIAWAVLDSTLKVRDLNDLAKIETGERIGLKFKASAVQLEIDTKPRCFYVSPHSTRFTYNPGDKLIDLELEGDEFVLNENWKIIEIGPEELLLENEVIHGKSKRYVLFKINRNKLAGFYKHQNRSGKEIIYSDFMTLAKAELTVEPPN